MHLLLLCQGDQVYADADGEDRDDFEEGEAGLLVSRAKVPVDAAASRWWCWEREWGTGGVGG